MIDSFGASNFGGYMFKFQPFCYDNPTIVLNLQTHSTNNNMVQTQNRDSEKNIQ